MKSLLRVEQVVPLKPQNATLHHIGFVVPSISAVLGGFSASLGVHANGEIIHDPLQQVRLTFLKPDSFGPSVELIEPVGPRSPVSKFADRGGGLHHLCYEVGALDDQLAFARSQGGIIVKPPLPAVAFGGRRIAWALTKYKLLLEYLEQ